MRSHKFFKTLFGKKKFIIWTDTGTHFRNNQFVNYLFNELKGLPNINEIRGKGLMIGIDLPEDKKEVKKNLLFKHHIFTGEAKPNVIRLLPALNITQKEADLFLEALAIELK